MSRNRRVLLPCDCESLVHVVALDYVDWTCGGQLSGQEPEIYVETILNPYRSWWARIWPAIKYVLGMGSGEVNASYIPREHIDDVISIATAFREDYDKFVTAKPWVTKQ